MDRRKVFELDKLLLTQGWSSYDWKNIYNGPTSSKYKFEIGVDYIIMNNLPNQKNLMIFPNMISSMQLVDFEGGQSKLERKGFFPFNDEKIQIGMITKRNKGRKPSFVINFSPIKIPEWRGTKK